MANCADCGKDLVEMDMAMGACQGCGEMLTPDTDITFIHSILLQN